ncbi:MAG: hypothetical protein IPK31_14020 [Chitinophagaceae bacterium]|nr:hypothetical protein [Chitinophagaceae bacterium]
MKKVIALFSSLLIFAGVKAQTTPTVKKETTAPTTQTIKPVVQNVPIKDPGTATIKKTDKITKIGSIKKTNVVPLKETSVTKPDKH